MKTANTSDGLESAFYQVPPLVLASTNATPISRTRKAGLARPRCRSIPVRWQAGRARWIVPLSLA
jgi:hypothetical protein